MIFWSRAPYTSRVNPAVTLWPPGALRTPHRPLSTAVPRIVAAVCPPLESAPIFGLDLMTTDPLQQLLDDVSMAMNYARAGLVDQGYRLLIERCALSAQWQVDTRVRYRAVIQSFERRWKIRYH